LLYRKEEDALLNMVSSMVMLQLSIARWGDRDQSSTFQCFLPCARLRAVLPLCESNLIDESAAMDVDKTDTYRILSTHISFVG
jgi:hypothetical protein